MSIQDLPKTLVLTAVKLVRIPLELLERAIPGRGPRPPASERLEPDPGVDDRPRPDEGLKPDPDAPKPKKPAAPKPASKRGSSTAKKPAAKKASGAKKPAAKKKPATKRSSPKPRNTTAAEEPGVVDEATDGLEAATDRAVKAREEIEQAAEASGDRR
jgi:hypothetical protein